MNKGEIIAELPKLSAEDRAEIQNRLEELAGDGWVDGGELTEADRSLLGCRLAHYEQDPEPVVHGRRSRQG